MARPAVLVPLKAFRAGKSRLAAGLGDGERESLVREMADRVLAASGGLDVHIATDDETVAAWAIAAGAAVVWTRGLDLNGSVELGLSKLRAAGHDPLLVAHADLPFADGLAALTHFPGVTIVPDRRDDGTNVVCLPADVTFAPEYGARSFSRHLTQMLRSGRPVRVCRRASLQWDVDAPSDLPGFRRLDVPA